jgi:hypothetical protein
MQVSEIGGQVALAGRTAVAAPGTPVPLGSGSCGKGVYIKPDTTNTDVVFVFPKDGAKTDVEEQASTGGEVFWPVSNLDALLVDADVAGEGVYWRAAI